jgi:hypothetical protein
MFGGGKLVLRDESVPIERTWRIIAMPTAARVHEQGGRSGARRRDVLRRQWQSDRDDLRPGVRLSMRGRAHALVHSAWRPGKRCEPLLRAWHQRRRGVLRRPRKRRWSGSDVLHQRRADRQRMRRVHARRTAGERPLALLSRPRAPRWTLRKSVCSGWLVRCVSVRWRVGAGDVQRLRHSARVRAQHDRVSRRRRTPTSRVRSACW